MNNSNEDLKHLSLLAIFHYLMGGFMLYASIITLGRWWPDCFNQNDPASLNRIFLLLGLFCTMLLFALAICLILTARSLQKRMRYKFCFIMACVECLLCGPPGIILGIFTIILLYRESAKKLFNEKAAP